MLADALEELAFLREKLRLDHKAIQLLQRKAHAVSAAAGAGVLRLQEERAGLERELRGQLLEQEVQTTAARAEVDQWKRRAGLLQLQLSSAREDADMYAMRVRLLEAEVGREEQRSSAAEVGGCSLRRCLVCCMQPQRGDGAQCRPVSRLRELSWHPCKSSWSAARNACET